MDNMASLRVDNERCPGCVGSRPAHRGVLGQSAGGRTRTRRGMKQLGWRFQASHMISKRLGVSGFYGGLA